VLQVRTRCGDGFDLMRLETLREGSCQEVEAAERGRSVRVGRQHRRKVLRPVVERGEVERGERSALREQHGEVGTLGRRRRALVPAHELDAGELRPGGEEEEVERSGVARVDGERSNAREGVAEAERE